MTVISRRNRRCLVVALCTTLLGASTVCADGVIERNGREVAVTPGRGLSERCADETAACSTSLLRVLSGLSFARFSGTLDYRREGGLAGGLTIDAIAVDYPIGSAHAGRSEILFLPDGTTTRLRFTLAEIDVLFTCRDGGDALRPPILAQMMYRCMPGSRLGVGAMLGELAWDPVSGRIAARWARLDVVLNLAGSPNSMSYLRRHLDASVGVAGESVWHGDDERAGSDHVARGRLALAGLLRSGDGRWEANLKVEVMPVVIGTAASFRDYGVTSRAMLLGRWLVSSRTILSMGLDLRADHWSDPSTSIGAFDSTTRNTGIFVGAIAEVRRGL